LLLLARRLINEGAMMSAVAEPVGELEVTVRFRFSVSDLSHYEAEDLNQAAVNLAAWYEDGSADVYGDMTVTPGDMDIAVVAVNKA
jgi:hypothetical protein